MIFLETTCLRNPHILLSETILPFSSRLCKEPIFGTIFIVIRKKLMTKVGSKIVKRTSCTFLQEKNKKGHHIVRLLDVISHMLCIL